MLSVIELACQFGARTLFSNVRFQLNPGRRYGLVGANGSGKSSLIKILSGELTPEKGEITCPNDWVVGTLKQEHFLFEEMLILDVVIMGKKALWQALEKKEELLKKGDFTEDDCHLLDDLEVEIQRLGGYEAQSHAAKILAGLGIEETQHKEKMNILSGGYKLRVLLAQVLFTEPDVLLLDEPTNHLDIFSIQWLEDYLKNVQGVVLFTSHDRNFLNGICTDILDLDHERITPYKGNYEDFLEKKLLDQEHKAAFLEKQEKKKGDIQGFIDRFRSKASKARQAQSKMHLVKKLEEEMAGLDMAPTSRKFLNLKFDEKQKSASRLLTVKELNKAFGEKEVLNRVTFEIVRKERVAFIGVNGIGKSTLLNILMNQVPKDNGKVDWGASAQVGYFPQDHSKEVYGESTVYEWLAKQDSEASENKVRSLLGRVLFTQDDVKKPVSVLSGGERARLILAKMMLLPHNVLIFDEPTNHLDMEGTESLVEALQVYEGTLLIVSHNRDFINRVANRIIEITHAHGIVDFPGTYDEFCEKRQVDLLAKERRKKVKTPKEERIEKRQEDKQLKRQIANLEKKCAALESEIEKIDALFGSDGYYEKTSKEEVQKMGEKKKSLEKELQDFFEKWCLLSE